MTDARGGSVSVTGRPFGTLPDGTSVELYAIKSDAVEIYAMTYGGIITSLRVRDRYDQLGDVVLGYPAIEPYLHNESYFGAIVGRYANRIAGGTFRLDGLAYQLATNDGPNHLHGGMHGFDRRLWVATHVCTPDAAGVTFTRTSAAGEEQYPGTLEVAVSYLLSANGTVALRYEATTDAPTIVNLTQHTYFNLAGEASTSVLDHELTIHAGRYTPVGKTLIPTGVIARVDGTPFDFRTPTRLGARVQLDDEQLHAAGGFDHNFVLGDAQPELALAAKLHDAHSGRVLEISTTEPGLQFYAGHLLDGRTTGAYGRVFSRYAGLCLEPQHYPDSPNHPRFPSVTLRPGERYTSATTWRFTASGRSVAV
jgi:aldose 1-epimerase